MNARKIALGLVCAGAMAIGAVAPQVLRAMEGQATVGAPQGRGGGAGGGAQQGGGGGNQGRAGGIVVVRNYADVITGAGLKTQDGIFKVHRITDGNSDQLFYEIPRAELNKDYLWDTQLKKTAIGNGYGGQSIGNRVVRWLLKDNRVLLVNMDYSSVADPSNVLMDEANQPAIIQAFPVQAYKGDDKNAGDPVINVTTLFTGNVAEFAAGRGVGGTGAPDPARTFLEKANAYPQNINVEVTATWAIAEQAADATGGGGGGRGGPAEDRLYAQDELRR